MDVQDDQPAEELQREDGYIQQQINDEKIHITI